jgi:hypothetical protein
MKEVGIIKWFGGYSPNNGKLNDYGYIIRKNKADLYFNRSHIRCKVKELVKGTAVSFETGMNFKNNMEQAFKVKPLKNEDKEFVFNEEVFLYLSSEEKMKFISDYEEKYIANLWRYMDLKLKIILLFKISSENMDTSILEKLIEENKFIRAMIIITWIKNNADKKSIIYEKAKVLLSIYRKEVLDDEEKLKELKFAFPQNREYKVDTSKDFTEWTTLELLQNSNITNIVDDIESGDKELINLVRGINEYMKLF